MDLVQFYKLTSPPVVWAPNAFYYISYGDNIKAYLTSSAGVPKLLATYYVHNQAVASDTWTVTHNLGYNPNVNIQDTAEDTVFGRVTYLNLNSLQISFSAAFAGTAYLT